MAEIWYYAEQDETKGPLSLDELTQVLRQQPRPDKVLVWREGHPDWLQAGEVPELSRFIVRPPPLPSMRPPTSPTPPPVRSPRPPAFKLPPEPAPAGWTNWVAYLGGSVIGLILARAFGMTFWFPALGILVSFWALTRIKAASAVVPMLSILIGHTLWMFIGHAALWSANKPDPELVLFIVEFVAVAAMIIWCVKSSSLLSCLAVLAYQGLCVVALLVEFETVEQASVIAAVMHLLLRAAGICAAIYAIMKIRQRDKMAAFATGAR
jgi:hypothetical protein